MVAIVILTLNFTLSCSEEAVPAWVGDMGPGAKQLWNRASALGLDPDIVHEMMAGINSGNRRTEEVQGLIESCKEDGVDIVAFLQQMVQDPVLPKGGPHWDEGISEMDVLRWLARASNPSVDEWLLTFAKTRLTGCVVQSEDDVRYLNGLLTVLGKMRRDETLEFLLEVQSAEFWKSDESPKLNLPPVGGIDSSRRNLGAKSQFRQSAINAISLTATPKAIEILGTGREVSPDLHGMLDDCFLLAVRHNVGVYGFPEWYGAKLPKEKLAQIKEIYAEYGKTYTPIKENKREQRMSPPHHP